MLSVVVGLLGLFTIVFPDIGFAETTRNASQDIHLELTKHWAGYFSLLVMVIAYIAAMLEEATELRKSKPMVLTHRNLTPSLYKINAGSLPSKSRVSAVVADTSFFRHVDR